MHYKLQRRQDAKLEDHLEMHPKTPQKKDLLQVKRIWETKLDKKIQKEATETILATCWCVGSWKRNGNGNDKNGNHDGTTNVR